MRIAMLGVLLATAGCNPLLEGVVGGVLDGFEVYTPPPQVTSGSSRLAFVTSSDSANVVCFILNANSTDLVATFGEGAKPVAIAAGGNGQLFVSTADGIRRLGSTWVDLGEIRAQAGVEAFGALGTDAGVVVVAGETAAGPVVAVYDDGSGALLDVSDPAPAATITSVTVNGDMAFTVEDGTTIAAYDLATSPPERTVLVPALPGDAVAVVVGHTGNLFVARTGTGVAVEEIDAHTGATVGVLWEGNPFSTPVALAFDGPRERYLVLTDDDRLVEVRADGTVAASHGSGLVDGVNGVAFVGR